jgi:hypothetical protein
VMFPHLLQSASLIPTDASALESSISALETAISALEAEVRHGRRQMNSFKNFDMLETYPGGKRFAAMSTQDVRYQTDFAVGVLILCPFQHEPGLITERVKQLRQDIAEIGTNHRVPNADNTAFC